MVFNIEVYDVR